MHRSYEFRITITPAHPPRYGQGSQRIVHDAWQQVAGKLTRHVCTVVKPCAFRRLDPAEALDRYATALSEGLRGARRLALCIESHGKWRTALFHALPRLGAVQGVDADSQPTRCCEGTQLQNRVPQRSGWSGYARQNCVQARSALWAAVLRYRSQRESQQFASWDQKSSISVQRVLQPAENRVLHGCRSMPAQPDGPFPVRAKCSAGAHSPKLPGVHPAG